MHFIHGRIEFADGRGLYEIAADHDTGQEAGKNTTAAANQRIDDSCCTWSEILKTHISNAIQHRITERRFPLFCQQKQDTGNRTEQWHIWIQNISPCSSQDEDCHRDQ